MWSIEEINDYLLGVSVGNNPFGNLLLSKSSSTLILFLLSIVPLSLESGRVVDECKQCGSGDLQMDLLNEQIVDVY